MFNINKNNTQNFGITEIEYKEDPKIPNAGTFTIYNEDHTIGNLLKTQIFNNKREVKFVGYKKPHPLNEKIELKIQTIEGVKPIDVFRKAIEELRIINNTLRRSFQDQIKKFHVN